jgi:transposase-like protein
MEHNMDSETFKAMQAKALEQLMSGQSLTGKDGAFAPLLKQFLETALQAEMNGHLDADERIKRNKRNGKGSKTLKTAAGEITPSHPRLQRG